MVVRRGVVGGVVAAHVAWPPTAAQPLRSEGRRACARGHSSEHVASTWPEKTQLGDVRFDVDDGSAVDHIEAAEVQRCCGGVGDEMESW